MAMSYFGGPFDSKLAKQHATASDPWAKDWLKNNDAGFGPYHIVKNIPGQEMELVRNENFQPKPPIKRILIRIVPDPATRTALLERGAVDYAMRLPERSLQALAKNPATSRSSARKANFIPYIGPVQTNEIMAKTKVRQAMACATPFDEIHEKVYFGQGSLIKSITPAIFPNYTDKFWVYKYDPAKAKALLAEAGYPSGFDLKLSFDNSIAEMAETAVLVKAAYDGVGIRTTLDPLPAAVYSERKLRRQLMCQVDNFQWPWIADTGYTGWVYLGPPRHTVNNSVYFNNPEFNELVTKMMQMPLGDERTKMDLRVQEIAATGSAVDLPGRAGLARGLQEGLDQLPLVSGQQRPFRVALQGLIVADRRRQRPPDPSGAGGAGLHEYVSRLRRQAAPVHDPAALRGLGDRLLPDPPAAGRSELHAGRARMPSPDRIEEVRAQPRPRSAADHPVRPVSRAHLRRATSAPPGGPRSRCWPISSSGLPATLELVVARGPALDR